MASKLPVQRNPKRTRRRLLQVAIKQFSSKGFHAVSVDQIVASAKVNKRMVYHYFRSKELLYEEVLAEVYKRIESIELDAVERDRSPRERLSRLLKAYFEFLDNNPEFVRLLLWENLEKWVHVDKHAVISKDSFLVRLQEVLEDGVVKGEFRAELDMKHLVIHLIGLCFIYHSNRFSLSQSLTIGLNDRKVRLSGLDQVIALVFEGISKKRTRHSVANAAGQ